MAMLLTTLTITLFGMGLLHMGMQKGFSRYVAEVEMQGLDAFILRLAQGYARDGDWHQALNNAKLRGGEANIQPDVARYWLSNQYDMMMRELRREKKQAELKEIDVQLHSPLSFLFPSNAPPPHDANIRDGSPPREGRRSFFGSRDRLGLGQRLVLYDQSHQYISGVKTEEKLPTRVVRLNQKIIGYLAIKPALDPADALSINFFSAQSRYWLLIYGACFLVSAFASLLLAAHFRNPIKALLNTSSELIKGNYDQHINITRSDELGDLASAINHLSHILHQHEQSRRQWVADTSHELRTPISVLQVQIEALQDGIRQATPTHLAAMQRQVMTLKKLVQDLNELSQADVGQLTCYFVRTDPWCIVQQEVDSFQQKFSAKQMQIETAPMRHEITLMMDPDRIRQVVVNLLENSWRYTNEQGRVRVSCHCDETHWYLLVDDTPPSVPSESLARLGERFYRVDYSRTRETGGTGLGLALSKHIAQIHAGTLHFEHSPLGGIRAVLRLPLSAD